MASLEKIKICGIRSFGPNEEDVQTIKFQKPLTLILGENGCGKSTVIECLRYLTAQKEPAGKGTFVHDPSLTGRTSVSICHDQGFRRKVSKFPLLGESFCQIANQRCKR